MATIVKIDGHAIDVEEFMRTLKLTGQFEALLEQFVRDRLAALGARKAGIKVSEAEIQERADQFRRVRGLHRASDTNKYLDAMRISLDEFEAFITDSLYQEKLMQQGLQRPGRTGILQTELAQVRQHRSQPYRPRFREQSQGDAGGARATIPIASRRWRASIRSPTRGSEAA